MDQYLTIKTTTSPVELTVKGSKFISRVFPVKNSAEAEHHYHNIRKQYHDASHNCYAYRIDDVVYRYNDDGEPSGTAGRPIFEAIKLQNIYQILIIITRYFGGTKLGTGGLCRAYSDAALMALEEAEIITCIAYTTTSLQTTYVYQQRVNKVIKKFEGKITHTDYTDKINMTVRIPKSKFTLFQDEVRSLIQRNIITLVG
jgi:uncharacterized YigZ family protein